MKPAGIAPDREQRVDLRRRTTSACSPSFAWSARHFAEYALNVAAGGLPRRGLLPLAS